MKEVSDFRGEGQKVTSLSSLVRRDIIEKGVSGWIGLLIKFSLPCFRVERERNPE